MNKIVIVIIANLIVLLYPNILLAEELSINADGIILSIGMKQDSLLAEIGTNYFIEKVDYEDLHEESYTIFSKDRSKIIANMSFVDQKLNYASHNYLIYNDHKSAFELGNGIYEYFNGMLGNESQKALVSTDTYTAEDYLVKVVNYLFDNKKISIVTLESSIQNTVQVDESIFN